MSHFDIVASELTAVVLATIGGLLAAAEMAAGASLVCLVRFMP